MNDITSIKNNIIQYTTNINKISEYLLALQSTEDNIDCKLQKSKKELVKIKDLYNENISLYKRIKTNLFD
jgi:hypothetical protein